MPANLFVVRIIWEGGFYLSFVYLRSTFSVLPTCIVTVEHIFLNPTCLRTPGVPGVVLLLVILLDLFTRLTGVLSVVFVFLVIVFFALIAPLACLCVVTIPRGTLGYSRLHELQPS